MPSGVHTGRGAKHARPPAPPPQSEPEALDALPGNVVDGDDVVVDTDLPPSTRPRGGKRKTLRGLPDDDPFVLLAQIDATGGVDGTKKRMNNTQAAAFRAYCLLGPDVRSLVALHKRLERDWGKPPRYETLKVWAKEWQWETLAGDYDSTLDRLRLWQREQAIREMDERQAKKNRALQEMASGEIAKIVRDFNAGPRVLRDAQGQVIYNRRGEPALAPRPTLAGIQGLAVLYKIAQEGERVALGAPTGNAPTVIQAQQHQTLIDARQQTTVVPLDEWRRHTSAERLAAALGEGNGAPTYGEHGPTQPLPVTPRALPAPERAPITARVVEALTDEDAGDLPDDWFPGGQRATGGPDNGHDSDRARRAADPLLGGAPDDGDSDDSDESDESE